MILGEILHLFHIATRAGNTKMPSCWLAAANGLKEGKKGHHWKEGEGDLQCQNLDQPDEVKGLDPREFTVMMMPSDALNTRLYLYVQEESILLPPLSTALE